MIGEGEQVKLLDFGLAKLSSDLGYEGTPNGGTVDTLFGSERKGSLMAHSEHSSDSELAPTLEQPPAIATTQPPPIQGALTLAGAGSRKRRKKVIGRPLPRAPQKLPSLPVPRLLA